MIPDGRLNSFYLTGFLDKVEIAHKRRKKKEEFI